MEWRVGSRLYELTRDGRGLVQGVQPGPNAGAFVATVICLISINSQPLEWGCAVVTDSSPPCGEITISVSGAELPASLGGPSRAGRGLPRMAQAPLLDQATPAPECW
jgi:hypothetical protein